jgi:hypothetical protein
MSQIIFDQQEQLDKISASLIPGEAVEAVLDLKGAATGFLGITTKRIIIYDKAYLRRLKAVVSVPYSKILSIAAEDDNSILAGRGWFSSSKLAICTSHGDYEFEFRGADKAHIAHDLILAHLV